MSIVDNVYKTLEIAGSSPNSIEEAVATALARTANSVYSIRWFEVAEVRGHIKDEKIDH